MTARGIECFFEKPGSRKIWAKLEISEVFVIGLEVSFSGDFVSRSLDFLKPGSRSLAKSQICQCIPLPNVNEKQLGQVYSLLLGNCEHEPHI